MADDDERQRGMLAPVDRQYLRGEKTYTHRQTEYDRRETIKERVKNGVLDFTELSHLTADQRADIFEDYGEDPEFRKAIQNAIAFFFEGIADREGLDKTQGGQPYSQAFNNDLEEGMFLGLLEHDFLVEEFEATIKGQRIEGIETARELALDGEDLSPAFVRVLLAADAIDSEPVQEAIRETLINELPGDE